MSLLSYMVVWHFIKLDRTGKYGKVMDRVYLKRDVLREPICNDIRALRT